MTTRPHRRTRSAGDGVARGDVARGCLLASLTALYIARPLLPSETAITAGDGEGLPFVVLLLVVGVGWLLAAVGRRELSVRAGWADVGWIMLLAAQAASTYAAARHDGGRPSINMFWEWVAFGFGFFLVRQLVQTAREARAVAAVMVGLAVALSGFGLYEFFVSRPDDRVRYQRDPEGMLRDAGIVAPPGSPTRQLFENRLAASEPTATFSLANSLAGFLAPWLIVVVGLGAIRIADCGLRTADWPSRGGWPALGAAVCALPVAMCLLLTKSRGAWLASALGLACLAVWTVFSVRRHGVAGVGRKAVLGGLAVAAALAGLVSAVFATGTLDRQIATEALKSLDYRWQYWQASWAMIEDHFWLGCGAGNFQDFYTQYKLPEASEVVADPHNFLFEVWATAGTPAMVGLLLVVAGAICDARNGRNGTRSWNGIPSPTDAGDGLGRPPNWEFSELSRDPLPFDVSAYVLVGGLLGFLSAWAIGQAGTVPLGEPALLGGLALAGMSLAILYSWVCAGRMPVWLPWLGAAVLAVHLLAAGGIGFPGVAGSLWLLMALGLREADGRAPRRLSRRIGRVALGCLLAATVVCGQTAYLPVMRSRTFLLQAESRRSSVDEIEPLLLAAARADPRSDEAHRRLADWAFARWNEHPSPELLSRWRRYQADLLRLRPKSSASWQQAGDRFFAAYHHGDDESLLREAIGHYKRAVLLYPNQATLRGRWSLALNESGARKEAAEEAARALELDRLTPHTDQKLPPELRPELLRITAQGH
ncbi:MAG TPA: O-antigen ligase family protein [Pirellulales bacterium]|nr:O-antigen ligase family protein [Pirellulales bacterium]